MKLNDEIENDITHLNNWPYSKIQGYIQGVYNNCKPHSTYKQELEDLWETRDSFPAGKIEQSQVINGHLFDCLFDILDLAELYLETVDEYKVNIEENKWDVVICIKFHNITKAAYRLNRNIGETWSSLDIESKYGNVGEPYYQKLRDLAFEIGDLEVIFLELQNRSNLASYEKNDSSSIADTKNICYIPDTGELYLDTKLLTSFTLLSNEACVAEILFLNENLGKIWFPEQITEEITRVRTDATQFRQYTEEAKANSIKKVKNAISRIKKQTSPLLDDDVIIGYSKDIHINPKYTGITPSY